MNKYELAQNIDADPAELTELARDKYLSVRSYVARNPSAPCEVLESLLLDLETHDTVFSALLKRNKNNEQA